ncbi:unannotated protein [freshwater metagenome]|uniref:Unannotated protein n=1 Tax=freshwater metagenome TaxID=449393 RepID=A0A6J6PGP4_9ZZZZ|nr:amidohydrolase family protein [Actinomycetota bacterium]MSV64391.1 amidohydrolase family protein [Actinomycetota bacterium]MSW26269.1 amidohydrolase family protein [Actinomycetota bacterium]MSW34586.1 amidohydrolase family protein [Actinomycetota bacterium]MSX31612.1 amidohydrolase family protein [Actinomycetota bacterium]
MRIDAHHHIWNLEVRDQEWIKGDLMAPLRRNFSMTDLRAAVAGTGIDRTVLVQTVTNYDETPELLEIAELDPMVAGVVGWLKIDAPDALDHLDQYLELPGADFLVGIRDIAHDEPDANYLSKPNVINNVKELGTYGLVYDLLTKTPQLAAGIALVKAAPDTQFVMDHISKPYVTKGEMEPWATMMRELASLPNVVCKISGMITEGNWNSWKSADFEPYTDLLLEIFGPQRLMFGSDWPVATLAGTYKDVVTLAESVTRSLSASEADAFWSTTAIRAYRLPI